MHAETNGEGSLTARTRTLKAMRSALAGIPIVSTDWIRVCGEQNKAMEPSPSMYVRSLPTKTDSLQATKAASHGVSLVAADLHRFTNPKLALPLSKMSVYLCGNFSQNKRNDIQIIAKESGGKVLSSLSAVTEKLKSLLTNANSNSRVILICDDSSSNCIPNALEKDIRAALDHDKTCVMVVSPTWLFDTVSCGSALPATSHEPFAPRAKELWKLASESDR